MAIVLSAITDFYSMSEIHFLQSTLSKHGLSNTQSEVGKQTRQTLDIILKRLKSLKRYNAASENRKEGRSGENHKIARAEKEKPVGCGYGIYL